jgi:hypothetical protein
MPVMPVGIQSRTRISANDPPNIRTPFNVLLF